MDDAPANGGIFAYNDPKWPKMHYRVWTPKIHLFCVDNDAQMALRYVAFCMENELLNKTFNNPFKFKKLY